MKKRDLLKVASIEKLRDYLEKRSGLTCSLHKKICAGAGYKLEFGKSEDKVFVIKKTIAGTEEQVKTLLIDWALELNKKV